MKVTDEDRRKEIGYAKLCMNFVHYQLNDSETTHVQ